MMASRSMLRSPNLPSSERVLPTEKRFVFCTTVAPSKPCSTMERV